MPPRNPIRFTLPNTINSRRLLQKILPGRFAEQITPLASLSRRGRWSGGFNRHARYAVALARMTIPSSHVMLLLLLMINANSTFKTPSYLISAFLAGLDFFGLLHCQRGILWCLSE